MFPSEMEQITFIDQQAESEKPSAFAMPKEEQPPAEPDNAKIINFPSTAHEPESEKPSGLSVPDEEIDRLLRNGSGHHDSKLRIAALYAGDSTPADRTEYLKNEYGTDGGRGWQFFDGTHGNIQYRPQGLVIRNAD